MSSIVNFRQVSALPTADQLEAGTLYFVADGADRAKLYVTNTAGTITARMVHDGELGTGSTAPTTDTTVRKIVIDLPVGTHDYALPAGIFEAISAVVTSSARIGIYASAEDRTTDTNRFLNTPTVEPTVNPRLLLNLTANTPVACERRGLTGTLFIRSTAATQLTLTLKEV